MSATATAGSSEIGRDPTQQEQVLALLRLAGAAGLTPAQAQRHAGCWRLAAVVHRLTHDKGYDIRNEGQPGRHARYVLHERPQQLGLALL